jgi:hypothetical protein
MAVIGISRHVSRPVACCQKFLQRLVTDTNQTPDVDDGEITHLNQTADLALTGLEAFCDVTDREKWYDYSCLGPPPFAVVMVRRHGTLPFTHFQRSPNYSVGC